MTPDRTPTESLIGYDANGIPARHTSPASRQHTDQHEDTTRIILPGPQLPPQTIRQSVSQVDILRSSGYESPDVKPFYPHKWDRDGDRCEVCGDKDWMGGSCRAPDVKPVDPQDLDALDRLLEPLRSSAAHLCPGCGVPLAFPGHCFQCIEAIEGEGQSLRQGTPWWVWLIIGAFAGVVVLEAARLVFG